MGKNVLAPFSTHGVYIGLYTRIQMHEPLIYQGRRRHRHGRIVYTIVVCTHVKTIAEQDRV